MRIKLCIHNKPLKQKPFYLEAQAKLTSHSVLHLLLLFDSFTAKKTLTLNVEFRFTSLFSFSIEARKKLHPASFIKALFQDEKHSKKKPLPKKSQVVRIFTEGNWTQKILERTPPFA